MEILTEVRTAPPAAPAGARGSRVEINLVPRPPAQDLGPAPGRDLREGRAFEEGVEALPAVPLAEDQVAAGGRHVFVQLGLDVPGDGVEVLDHPEESLLEFLLLAGDH